jgi:hypothetical protein
MNIGLVMYKMKDIKPNLGTKGKFIGQPTSKSPNYQVSNFFKENIFYCVDMDRDNRKSDNL